MEGSSTRSEALARQQLAIQRANLLGVCRMCIKSIVDKSAFETISDDCPHLQNFCNTLEHIFTHRLQVRWTLFQLGGTDSLQYWHVISRLAPAVSVGSVQDMGEVQTELGKGRAWIHLSLVQKKLSTFMHSLLSRQDFLRSLYLPGAFLCSEELTELAGTLKCLDAIDFSLCLRGQDFDSGERQEISYYPYLQFQQSLADDSAEEKKLRSSMSRKVRLWNEGEEEEQEEEEEEEEEEGEGKEERGGEVNGDPQLREMIKTEREQKNYFEELVSVRDTQLSKSQAEISFLSQGNERLRKEMEDVVLELQRQLEQRTVELREAQRRVQELSGAKKLNSIPENPQNSSPGSPRKRATSFSVFSSFLGSD